MSAGFRAGQANDGYLQINGTDILTVSSGVLGVKNTGAQSEMRLYCESNNAHYASLKSPPHSDFIGNVTFTLPGTSGSSGQVLQTDGSGNLSWVNQSGGGGGGGVSDKMSEGNTEAEVVDTGSDGHFKVTTEGVERLRVTSTGNITVGTSSAAGNKLFFQSTTGFAQYIASGGTGNQDLIVGTSASEFLRIKSNGNFGVGTDNPGSALHILSSLYPTATIQRDHAVNYPRLRLTNTSNHGADLDGIGDGVPAGGFRVSTITSGTSTERLRVGPSGQIGLGGANYGTSGQVLTSGGASGAVSWTTISGGGGSYGDSNVDNHLNSGGASSGQILSWNGSDYAWVADQGGSGGGGISDVVDDTTPQLGGNLDLNSNNITGTGNIDITGNVNLGDNGKFVAGAGDDLQIYHDATNSYIENSTGSFFIDQTVNDNDLNFRCDNGSGGLTTYIQADGSTGKVKLFDYGSLKFETTNTGVSVTGDIQLSSHLDMPDSAKINLGTDDDLQIYHDGSHSWVREVGTGSLQLSGGRVTMRKGDAASEYMFTADADGAVELYYNNSKKFETTGVGVTVTGTLTATTFSGSGANLTNLPAANITGTLPAISGANLTNLPSDTPADTDVQVTYDLSANGSSAYRFTGPGYSGADDNPDLYLVRGQRYRFINATGGHPFRIQSNTSGTAYTDGVSGSQTGTQDFNVQHDAPSRLYYQCTSHSAMIGNIYIVGASDWRMTNVATSATPEIFTNLNVGIGTNNPGDHLEILNNNASGLTFKTSQNHYAQITSDCNRTGANSHLLAIEGHWNGTPVAEIALIAGSDTTNKDDGQIIFRTSSANNLNSNERLRITAAGRVGIGTDNPAYQLSIHGTDAVRNEIVCTNNNSAGAGIYLRTMNGGSTVSNATVHTNTSGDLLIWTGTSGASERLRITSDGNLDVTGGGNIIINEASKLYFEGDADDDLNAIWKSDATENTLFLTSRYNIANIIDSNNDDAASFWSVRHNATTLASSGELMRVQSDGNIGIGDNSPSQKLNVAGNIMLEGADQFMYLSNVGTGNAGIYVRGRSATSTLRSHSTGLFTWEVTGSEKMRLHAGGTLSVPTGIELGSGLDGTSANTLDDYEEGTWTPTSETGTISTTSAKYTKIGNIVHLNAYINNWSNTTSDAVVQIQSLPFNGENVDGNVGSVMYRYIDDTDGLGGDMALFMANGTSLRFYFQNSDGDSNYAALKHKDINGTNSSFRIQITYRAA